MNYEYLAIINTLGIPGSLKHGLLIHVQNLIICSYIINFQLWHQGPHQLNFESLIDDGYIVDKDGHEWELREAICTVGCSETTEQTSVHILFVRQTSMEEEEEEVYLSAGYLILH